MEYTNKGKMKGNDKHKSVPTRDEWMVVTGKIKWTDLPYVTYLCHEQQKFIKTKKTKITYSNILKSRKYERKKKSYTYFR